MWSFIAQYWNKVCMLLAGVTQHVRFHPVRAFCVGPCSGKAQYLGVYPRGTGLSPPSCRKFHCLKLDLSEHEMCGLLWVARIYLVNSTVRFIWGPCCMSCVYCLTLAYFSKGKVKNKKNWETKLILGVAMAKSSWRKRKSHQICHIWFS